MKNKRLCHGITLTMATQPFLCECKGPSEEQKVRIANALSATFEADATPLPTYSGHFPLTYSESDGCPCQQNWYWMTERLLMLIQERTNSIGTEQFTTYSQRVRDNLYVFYGQFLYEYDIV
jgi:hypothetical protein